MALLSRLWRRSSPRVLRARGVARPAAVLLGVTAIAAAVVGVATPAQAAPFDIAVASGHTDFGAVKQGTVVTQRFDLLNTGDDDIRIDPSTLGLLTTPFTAGNFTFSSTDRVHHLGVASFTVSYTAPSAGTNSRQDITVAVTDADHTDTPISLVLSFQGQSLATDPAHFEIVGAPVHFGSVTVGKSTTQTITLVNDGIIPLRFKNSGISVVNTSGTPIPDVTISNSSFGDAGADYIPGASATFDLTYAPAGEETMSGVLRIVGTQATNDPEPPSVIVETALTGAATAVVPPTSPPTSPPTAPPTATPTPTPGTGGSGGAGSGGSGTGTGTGSSAGIGGSGGGTGGSSSADAQLASTGLATQSPVLIGAAATSLGAAVLLLALAYRRSVQRGRRR
ncbi:choice-of-anchor D domain-containing protein [Subtercola endophyticus]|uniref:choice-of-anchor D domain-containing protein n=1 Tax=Subtercola endophyticus TaxID=2895559 RepID=UPI001E35FE1D|nr:choice-of-anchor D domain-containing protein [Subtercola endophyticus]UFS58463.1 choice-of-anchor D domain-containing protein [Subtercola endophyticus]